MSNIIYKKINDIQKKVGFVRKDGKLGYGQNQFSIVTHDAVVRAVREHLLDSGVLVIPTQVEKGVSIEGLTKNGGKKIRFEALYDVKFISIEDGSEIIIRTEAHAEDNSDKAANKAITYATKNAILKIFLLETGDDNNQEQKNKINLTQVALIQKLVVATDTDLKEFVGFYGVEKLADMPQDAFNHGMDLLQLKQKKVAK